MSGIAVTRSVTIREGGDAPLAVTVYELTVSQIRAWLKDVQLDKPVDLVEQLLIADVSLSDFVRLTSLKADQIEDLTPSQLRQVLEAAKELNADFFALRAGIMTVGMATLSARSKEPSVV